MQLALNHKHDDDSRLTRRASVIDAAHIWYVCICTYTLLHTRYSIEKPSELENHFSVFIYVYICMWSCIIRLRSDSSTHRSWHVSNCAPRKPGKPGISSHFTSHKLEGSLFVEMGSRPYIDLLYIYAHIPITDTYWKIQTIVHIHMFVLLYGIYWTYSNSMDGKQIIVWCTSSSFSYTYVHL